MNKKILLIIIIVSVLIVIGIIGIIFIIPKDNTNEPKNEIENLMQNENIIENENTVNVIQNEVTNETIENNNVSIVKLSNQKNKKKHSLLVKVHRQLTSKIIVLNQITINLLVQVILVEQQ